MAKRKILSLDGGGSWALIQAKVLKNIYGNITGHELLRKFDLAIANSGGSLVLTALCANKSLEEIIEIFTVAEKRNKAFVRDPKQPAMLKVVAIFSKAIKGMLPKYSADKKLEGLKELIGPAFADKKMREIPAMVGKPSLDIIIVSYDYTRNRAKFFRSNPNSHADFSAFEDVLLIEAAHASSNAPIRYFYNPAMVDVNFKHQQNLGPKELFWDGAVSGFNNPVLAGTLEYIVNNPAIDRSDIAILSIGTAFTYLPTLTKNAEIDAQKYDSLFQHPTRKEYFDDVEQLSTSILQDPPDSATYIAQVMLEPDRNKNITATNIVRMNPCISPVLNGMYYDYPEHYRTSAESRRQFDTLLEMDMDATENEQVTLINDFTEQYLLDRVSNQLIRGTHSSGDIIGHKLYSHAKQRWRDISGH